MRIPRVLYAGTCILTVALLGSASGQTPNRAGALPGEEFTPPAQGERLPDRLKTGDAAPEFTLPDTSGKKEVSLSSFQGKKPVVLIFGSCT